VEIIPLEVNRCHLLRGRLEARGVGMRVKTARDGQTGRRGRRRDQAQDHRVADQGLTAPVLGDEGEQAMLNLVPLARAGREVAHRDLQAGFVGQPLQLPLPEPQARSVAATAISRDQQAAGVGVARLPRVQPPAPDALPGEGRRVVVEPHVDPARVGGQVVDAVGCRPSQLRG